MLFTLTDPNQKNGISLLSGLDEHEPLLEFVTQLALRGSVRLIVGGNRFNAHQLARHVRRHTVELDGILQRVQLSRPFTCYQMVTLLHSLKISTPLVVIDLLQTFYDDNVSEQEAIRLVDLSLKQLRWVSQHVPVFVTLRPFSHANKTILSKRVEDAADNIYIFEQAQLIQQISLWEQNSHG
ncbi:MAG: hypothetical protein GY943_16245 [Chloroflexi bacterium]|nr:hypothetical protein [Chloroflexota bacterium]